MLASCIFPFFDLVSPQSKFCWDWRVERLVIISVFTDFWLTDVQRYEEVLGFCIMYFLPQISKCQTLRKFWHNFRVWKNALSLANRHTNISFYEWCSTLTLQGRKNWRNPVNLQINFIDTIHTQILCLIMHSFWLHTDVFKIQLIKK